MRIAVLIIGLLLGLLMFLQTLLVYGLSTATDDADGAGASAVGILMAFGWLIAAAIVLAFPLASTVVFTVAGALGLLVSGQFPDLGIWGAISLTLAVMSFFGWRGKRKQDRETRAEKARQGDRDRLLEQIMQRQSAEQNAPKREPT